MVSERIQRRIERYLDEADEAASRFDWEAVRQGAEAILAYDPENEDAKAHLSAVDRVLGAAMSRVGDEQPEVDPIVRTVKGSS